MTSPPSRRSGSWKSLSLSSMRGTPSGKIASGFLHRSSKGVSSCCTQSLCQDTQEAPSGGQVRSLEHDISKKLTPEAVQIAVYSSMDDLVPRGCVAIIKWVHNCPRKFLIRCNDNEDVPIGLHSPEECPGGLPLHRIQVAYQIDDLRLAS